MSYFRDSKTLKEGPVCIYVYGNKKHMTTRASDPNNFEVYNFKSKNYLTAIVWFVW
jgi:hypothetical protein